MNTLFDVVILQKLKLKYYVSKHLSDLSGWLQRAFT